MARKKIIAGNWKMNKTPSEAVALVEGASSPFPGGNRCRSL